jgi:hypothetical protein
MSDKSIIGGIVVLLLAVGGILFALSDKPVSAPTGDNSPVATDTSSEVAKFAQCLKDSGAVFYGAFWCPHCNEQKELFGEAIVPLLPYVECSTPDSKSQYPICIEKGVKSYPTWIFADGSVLTGVQQFISLSEKTGCPVPNQSPQIEVPADASVVAPASGLPIKPADAPSSEKLVEPTAPVNAPQ